MSFNKNTNTTADYDAVVAVVGGYVEGLKTGDIAQLKKTFHENAIMYGFSPDGLLEGTIKNLYTFVEQYGTAPNIATRLDVLDITPTTAVVRVTMENDAAGCDYTDYHSLIKIDGTWKVIAKLFHLYDK
ncbi:nuclear transport factor 2 family protein [Rhizobium leguminosarum]|uniref:nuclear transport factor 2 family protein n=1 Tax=Rhizobium leguminosarum TaxID=384 RepID=UPI00143F8B6F|nr:nuclear transport factor 2 family protein [Rhizobium leguminosarum]NKL21217.1 hypothetical protein [Rhizobium leguminosarum bv. viciae]NKL56920.1 hypothetical protein [Rhizobium leguminosarum bv. viciae]